jgi:hypothetical protein
LQARRVVLRHEWAKLLHLRVVNKNAYIQVLSKSFPL